MAPARVQRRLGRAHAPDEGLPHRARPENSRDGHRLLLPIFARVGHFALEIGSARDLQAVGRVLRRDSRRGPLHHRRLRSPNHSSDL